MARTSIGLDIGTRAVRLAEIQTGSQPTLTRFGRILIPNGAVDHGEVLDPAAVAAAITTLWKRLGLSGRSVHVGVSNRRVIVRVIEMPAMAADDLAGAIRYQAQEHIPIPLEEAVMDFEILEETTTPEGEVFQRVLVVAAERSTIASLLEAVRAANLEAATVELNAYPLVRCFANANAGAEAVIDIGAGVTNVVVHEGGKIRFTRILPTFGGDELTAAVAAGLGVGRDEAEVLKRKASALMRDRALDPVGGRVQRRENAEGGPQGPRPRPQLRPRGFDVGDLNQPPQPAEEPNDEVLHQAAEIIEPILDRFVTEVRGSLDFYANQPGATVVERIVLTGGGSLMGGIAERLGSALDVAVDHGDPFGRVPIGSVDVSASERAVAAPFIGVAVGLAMAGMK